MYATKPLSLFQSQPEAATHPPPDGRSSGYLVVKGPDDDDGETCCMGTCGGSRVRDLPFPQDRVLTVRYTENHGESSTTYADAFVFVPVPSQPLSSNRYYAVVATGKHRGLVRSCSREEDMATFCFCRCVRDLKPRPFDPADVYQQVEIVQRRRGRFTARAVASDGFPYFLFRKKYWRVYASKPKDFVLGEALGLNAALRSRQLAGTDDLLLDASPATVVGKWYCPFFLVKEDGVSPAEQMGRATFYEVTLEQRREPVRAHGGARRVLIGGSVEGRQEASDGGSRHGDGYVWFRAATASAATAGGQVRLGVCGTVWERMVAEEYKGGWVDEDEEAGNGRMAGGGSVLVERFVVKRMDGGVAVAFDFVHLTKVRAKQV